MDPEVFDELARFKAPPVGVYPFPKLQFDVSRGYAVVARLSAEGLDKELSSKALGASGFVCTVLEEVKDVKRGRI